MQGARSGYTLCELSRATAQLEAAQGKLACGVHRLGKQRPSAPHALHKCCFEHSCQQPIDFSPDAAMFTNS